MEQPIYYMNFGKQECNIPPYFHLQTCERKQVLMQTAALAKQEASMKFDPRIIQTPCEPFNSRIKFVILLTVKHTILIMLVLSWSLMGVKG